MKIEDINLEDAGNYKVLAENVAGKDESSADALILYTTIIDETPNIHPDEFKNIDKIYDENSPKNVENYKAPRFIIPLDDLKINEGDDVIFLCKVDGYPKPKV